MHRGGDKSPYRFQMRLSHRGPTNLAGAGSGDQNVCDVRMQGHEQPQMP